MISLRISVLTISLITGLYISFIMINRRSLLSFQISNNPYKKHHLQILFFNIIGES